MRSEVQNAWMNELTTKFESIKLRFEFNESKGEHTVCVGSRNYQPLKLELNVKDNYGRCEDSYSYEHFHDGLCIDGDMWGGRESYSTSQSFSDWVTAKAHSMIARHLNWVLEEHIEKSMNAPQKFCSALGDSPESRLIQREHDLSMDDNTKTIYRLMAITFKIQQGDQDSFDDLLEQLDDLPGSIDQHDSPFSLLCRHYLPHLNNKQIQQVMKRLSKRLEDDVRRICQPGSEGHRQFPTLKKRMAQTAPKVGAFLSQVLDNLHNEQNHPETDPKFAKISKLIKRYNRLRRNFAHYSPRGKKPHKDGKELIRIENEINQFWRNELDGLDGLAKNEITRVHVENGRFLSAGSCGYFGWLRNLGKHDVVVDGLITQTNDLTLCQLRHQSHPHAFEMMLNNALGSFLDGKNDEHARMGAEIIERLETVISWETNEALYQFACIFARSGHLERAIEFTKRTIELGTNKRYIEHDSDFDNVRHDPRFLALIA